jgi:2-polyprenyl-3-methyl-5-hydroxy-6-metoxy-1,4-benzoquinol methylase
MVCHICQTPTDPFEDQTGKTIFHYCGSCTAVFKSVEHHRPLDEQKKRYDLHENNEDDPGYRAYFQRFLDFVLPHIKEVERALDFGCGRSTLLSEMLEEHGIICQSYDPIYHPDTDYTDQTFDLIVSTEVFEHLHHPKEVFVSLVSLLKEGGYLAIQTQFHPNDTEAFRSWYYHKDPTHIVFSDLRPLPYWQKKYGCELLVDNGKNMVVLRKNEVQKR